MATKRVTHHDSLKPTEFELELREKHQARQVTTPNNDTVRWITEDARRSIDNRVIVPLPVQICPFYRTQKGLFPKDGHSECLGCYKGNKCSLRHNDGPRRRASLERPKPDPLPSRGIETTHSTRLLPQPQQQPSGKTASICLQFTSNKGASPSILHES